MWDGTHTMVPSPLMQREKEGRNIETKGSRREKQMENEKVKKVENEE